MTTVDKVALGIANTTVATANGAAAVFATSPTAAGTGAADWALGAGAGSNANDVIILNVTASGANTGTLSASTDGTELLKALTTNAAADTYTGITATAAGDKVYFAAVQGGVTYLYYASAGAGDTQFVAAEILLVGTFAAATLVGGDFTMITS